MTADRYQQAKTIFVRLLEASDTERKLQLERLRAESPELEQEVRSLLDYHTAESLIAAPVAPRIRTRSTLSTTYHLRSLDWLQGPLRCALMTIPLGIVAAIMGLWFDAHIQRQLKSSLAHHLSEAVDYRLKEFRLWEKQEVQRVASWGQHPAIAEPIGKLVEAIRTISPEDPELQPALISAECCRQLHEQFLKLAGHPVQFAVWDRRMITLVDWNQDKQPDVLGRSTSTAGARMLAPVLKGNAHMYLPYMSASITEGFKAETDRPILSILVPVYNSSTGAVIAAIMVRGYGLEEQYSRMLENWTAESLGEVYLLNGRGAMITQSRFHDQLDELQLAFDKAHRDRLPLLRDPGVDLTNHPAPDLNSSTWSPTLLARQVTSGDNGVSIEGYRNYVGRKVIGAWRWLPDHEVGIALEEDYDSAFAVAHSFRRSQVAIFSFLLLGILGIALGSSLRHRGTRRLRGISEVGAYRIQELLGEGGMGRVYLAEHAFLCRMSAIKVLTKRDNDLSVIGRFEREVQLASQLTHPNTIAIYDFGRNSNGVFYYAMEYINGAHLGQLVEFAGPIAPGRTIFILQQLCRALLEAHQAGVVHRDIKPQNIMVCNRGGEPDFVKLFDYGLVKAFAPGVSQQTSQTRVVVGTPRFMAPERLNSPWLADPRVDIYSVGALAYFLLTAQLPPLVAPGEELHSEQPGVETLDLPPGVVDFGGILSECMSVEPSSRPSSMSSLLRELELLAKKHPWSREDSVSWWSQNEPKLLRLVENKRKQLNAKTN